MRTPLSLSVLLLALAGAGVARAQLPDTSLWVTNGSIVATARIGGTLYVAGSFTRVGPSTGCAIPLDPVTAQPKLPFARVSGSAHVVISDQAGGWFVGGRFAGVEGTPRRNLIHLLADGSVAAWAPDPDSEVYALALAGSTLYVGGRFEHLGGAARYKIGAVDVATGAATAFDPHPLLGFFGNWPLIRALAVANGVVYVGGLFSSLGGQSQLYLGAVDPTTGLATSWNPQTSGAFGIVLSILPNGSTLYVGGSFTGMGGQPRTYLAEVNASDGSVTSWNPSLDGEVTSMTMNGTTLYVGGYFSNVNSMARAKVASFDRATGNLTSFAPVLTTSTGAYPPPNVNCLGLSGSTLYVGGWFDHINGQARSYLGAVDAASGAVLAWDPEINHSANALAVDAGTVLAAGDLTSLGGVARTNLAALNLGSGQPTPWAPSLNDIVEVMVSDGTSVWIGGYFTSVNGSTHHYAARLDAATGVVAPWDPGATNVVTCLALASPRLYIGGSFSNVLAVDPVTGAAFPWSPVTTNGPVNKIVPDVPGGAVNVASNGGLWRFSASDASQIWSATIDGATYSITQLGNALYLGGSFAHANGATRRSLAAFAATTGLLLPWAPDPVSRITSLTNDGSNVYATGEFTTIGGKARTGFAVLDPVTGAANDEDLHLDNGAFRSMPTGADLYLAGGFGSVEGFAMPGFAVVSGTGPLSVVGHAPVTLQLSAAPMPAHASSRITWTLPTPQNVALDVFDLQGRLVASPLRGDGHPAGAGGVTLATRDWRPGVYQLRLRAGGLETVRRIVVVP